MITDLMSVRLHVEQYGSAGPQVLLLHGWGCGIQHFEPIIRDLQKDHRLTALDFPAHGSSSQPPEPWDVHQFAKLTAQLIESLQLAPVHLVAHSFGARIALCLSTGYPDLIGRMVLTGAAGIRPPADPERQKKSAAYQRGKHLAEQLGKLPRLQKASDALREKLVRKYGSADYAALTPEMRATFSKIVSEDLSPLLPKVRHETLLVFGENDTETPLWMGRKMESEIPDAGLVVFEGRGHFAYLEEWPRFCAILRQFLV